MIAEEYTITFAQSLQSRETEAMNLYQFLRKVRDGEWRQRVEAVRSEADGERRAALKRSSPAVAFNECEGGFSADCVKRINPLLCIDIDGKDNGHIENFCGLLPLFKQMPFVIAAGHSIGGRGFFVLILTVGSVPFKNLFEALRDYFGAYGINVDKSCNDVNRRRLVSYDPELYINAYPKPCGLMLGQGRTRAYQGAYQDTALTGGRTTPAAGRGCFYELTDEEEEETARKVAESLRAVKVIDEYGAEWLRIGKALANGLGERGRAIFHYVSETSPKYERQYTDKQFDSWLRDTNKSISMGTFYALAEKWGADVSANRNRGRRQSPAEFFSRVHGTCGIRADADEWEGDGERRK